MRQSLLQEQEFTQQDSSLAGLIYRLSRCGIFATKNFYCKKVPGEEHLIKSIHTKFACEIRYCNKVDCLVERFVRQMQTFDDIKRFSGLRSLWHFSIGFEPISEDEFKKNFSKYKKRYEYVLNKYFEKLKKEGIKIQAVRVLDFSFKTAGQVFLHYHFGAIPISVSMIRNVLTTMKKIEMGMTARMRVKTPFHLQSFGLASKQSVLSYLSIRASGMYKYDMTENVDYKHIQGNLRGSIENHKYIFLKNILTEEEYLKSFYNKAHFVCIGGLPRPNPHGSNITDSIPSECLCHGHLERKDVRIEVIFDDEIVCVVPPPDFYAEEINSLKFSDILPSVKFKISKENQDFINFIYEKGGDNGK